MKNNSKSLYEEFTVFFENPTRDSLRKLLGRNFGESNQIDFKESWPESNKLAKHILAFANSGGGVILIGVSEKKDGSLVADGISEIKDKTEVMKGVRKYLPHQLSYSIIDFSFQTSDYQLLQGKKFQTVIIEETPHFLPFICQSDGENIRKAAFYVRRSANTEEASYEEIQNIINKRIETGYSSINVLSIDKELSELKALYSQIPRVVKIEFDLPMPNVLYEKNPNYPQETYDEFVNNLIIMKKKQIEALFQNSCKTEL